MAPMSDVTLLPKVNWVMSGQFSKVAEVWFLRTFSFFGAIFQLKLSFKEKSNEIPHFLKLEFLRSGSSDSQTLLGQKYIYMYVTYGIQVIKFCENH